MNKIVALVTGASRGIGAAIAAQLADDGFFVVGTATSKTGTDAIASVLKDNGAALVLNVADPDSIAQVIAQIGTDFAPPAVLVNNAGIACDNLLLRMKDSEWQTIIDTNLTSIFRLSKAVMRGMLKEKGGKIINISSIVAATGNPGQANYAAAKAGMIGFAKSMAKEVASRNITINTVAPGFIATDMTDAIDDEPRLALLSSIPLNRLGKPQDIAYAVSFLASERASYITGETLHVNGGMYMP